MPNETRSEKYLDLTTELVLAAIYSGKFEASDGQSVAKYFDEVYAQIYACAQLDSRAVIDKLAKIRH